VVVFKFNYYY